MNFKEMLLQAKAGRELAVMALLGCISRFWSSMRSSMEGLMKICTRSYVSHC